MRLPFIPIGPEARMPYFIMSEVLVEQSSGREIGALVHIERPPMPNEGPPTTTKRHHPYRRHEV